MTLRDPKGQDRLTYLVSIRGIRGFNGHVTKNENMIALRM